MSPCETALTYVVSLSDDDLRDYLYYMIVRDGMTDPEALRRDLASMEREDLVVHYEEETGLAGLGIGVSDPDLDDECADCDDNAPLIWFGALCPLCGHVTDDPDSCVGHVLKSHEDFFIAVSGRQAQDIPVLILAGDDEEDDEVGRYGCNGEQIPALGLLTSAVSPTKTTYTVRPICPKSRPVVYSSDKLPPATKSSHSGVPGCGWC